MKKLSVLLVLGVVLPLVLGLGLEIDRGQAVLAVDNYTQICSIYGHYDGYVWSSKSGYEDARNADQGTMANYVNTYFQVGQADNSGTGLFTVYRGGLQFDTSGFSDRSDITKASIFLWPKGNNQSGPTDNYTWGDNFTVVRGSDLGTPPTSGDFGLYEDNTSLGSYSGDYYTGGYIEVPLNAQGIASIVRGGCTKFGLMANKDIAGVEPSGSEWIQFWASESTKTPYLEITFSVESLGPPVACSILSAKVFKDFKEPGDQLYCFVCQVMYPGDDPVEISEDYFVLQLFDTDGATLRAQRPLPAWGYRPVSIYLSADSALSWGKSYVVKLVSLPGAFPESVSRSLTLGTGGATWQGEVSSSSFDKWVINWARAMGTYYHIDYITKIDNKTLLTAEGGERFLTGIPGLDGSKPELFSSSSRVYRWGDTREFEPILQNEGLNRMGIQLMTAFDGIGSYVGLSGTWINTGFWLLFTLGVVVTGLAAGLSIAGLAVGLPALILGLFMGIPSILGALLGITLMFLMAKTLWGR